MVSLRCVSSATPPPAEIDLHATQFQIRAAVNTLRSLVAKEGRDPFSLKVILGATLIIAETDELAKAKEVNLRRTASALGAEVLIGGWVRCSGFHQMLTFL